MGENFAKKILRTTFVEGAHSNGLDAISRPSTATTRVDYIRYAIPAAGLVRLDEPFIGVLYTLQSFYAVVEARKSWFYMEISPNAIDVWAPLLAPLINPLFAHSLWSLSTQRLTMWGVLGAFLWKFVQGGIKCIGIKVHGDCWCSFGGVCMC